MEDILDAIRKAIKDKNWYGALFISLTLPDICGKIEDPNLSSEKRYKDWFNRYISAKYIYSGRTFLSSNDCYAFRCALLHEGSDNIAGQKSRRILEQFLFMTSGPHCNYMRDNYVNCQRVKTSLQLRVDKFCEDICESVEQWLKDVSTDTAITNRNHETIKIYEPGTIYGGIKFG